VIPAILDSDVEGKTTRDLAGIFYVDMSSDGSTQLFKGDDVLDEHKYKCSRSSFVRSRLLHSYSALPFTTPSDIK
jgi:hypothetical protein